MKGDVLGIVPFLHHSAKEYSMATIDFSYPHKTTKDDAAARTKALLKDFAEEKKELIKSIEWADAFSAIANGRGFKGTFTVTDTEVVAAIDLALITRPFKAKVEERLKQRVAKEFG